MSMEISRLKIFFSQSYTVHVHVVLTEHSLVLFRRPVSEYQHVMQEYPPTGVGDIFDCEVCMSSEYKAMRGTDRRCTWGVG